MNRDVNLGDMTLEWEEELEYQPGLRVELKAQPGIVDTIASYEAMMVPPVWLVNDPQPRYPHELRILSCPMVRPVIPSSKAAMPQRQAALA